MIRLAILLVLLLLTVWEWRSGPRKAAYFLALTGLFAFFALRYGQGTDYLTYLNIYANVPPLYTFPNYFTYQLYNKVEIGYFYLMSLFRTVNLHYVLFVAIITLFSLFCIHRFIERFCSQPVFGLTVFFAVYSLIYMESGIRQLLAISIALGFVFIWWSEGRRLPAILCMAAATLMHTSAALLFLLPVLFWNPRPLYLIEWKPRTSALILLLLVAVAGVINFVDLSPVISLLPDQLEYTIMSYYADNGSLSLLALANRTLFMAIIFVLAWRARTRLSTGEKFLFNLYCVGYGIYLLFVSFDLIASRTGVYFKAVEIALLPLLFYRNRDLVKRTMIGLPAMLLLISFLYVKDITTTMEYAQYYSRNPLEYPYITIFNMDDLLKNKFVNVKNAAGMNAYQVGGLSYDEYYDSLQRKPSVRSPIVPY